MIRTRPLLTFRRLILPLGAGVAAALVLLTTLSLRSAQNPAPAKNGEVLSPPAAVNNQAALIAPKQNEEPKKSNLERTRTDAAELSALADQLRDELKKTNVNVLPLDVLEKTEKLEKLAKKIKGEANGS
jgi:ssRNA-specific RNase YbeY (16S rRNA maturation enzyme)